MSPNDDDQCDLMVGEINKLVDEFLKLTEDSNHPCLLRYNQGLHDSICILRKHATKIKQTLK